MASHPATASSSAPSAPKPMNVAKPRRTIDADADEGDGDVPGERSYKYAVFSDVDGTLVHYPEHLRGKEKDGGEDKDDDDDGLIYLPPSRTGTRGVISTRTLDLCRKLRHGNNGDNDDGGDGAEDVSEEQRIRNGGAPFVLVSGMRTTTLFQRLQYLPRADAYVSESGGRIFYPRQISGGSKEDGDASDGSVEGLVVHPATYPSISPSDAAPFVLMEDMDWKARISQMDAAGTDAYVDETPMDRRKGKLWDFARTLKERGYVLDCSGYATAFRINRKHQSADLAATFDDFLSKCANGEGVPDGLGCSTNLGCVDVYPAISGKKNCAEYLVRRFVRPRITQKMDDDDNRDGNDDSDDSISLKSHAFRMCDDDNDVEMALACKAAYLPSVTSDSVRRLVEESRKGNSGERRRLVATEDIVGGVVGTRATEAALEAILGEVRR